MQIFAIPLYQSFEALLRIYPGNQKRMLKMITVEHTSSKDFLIRVYIPNALFPHMNVKENISFAASSKVNKKQLIDQKF